MEFNGGNYTDEFANLIPDRTELECEQLFADADKLLGEGIITEAVEKLSTILKRNPRFGKAYNHLGWVYETKYKNAARAEEYYKAAIQYAPHYNAGYLNYAYFLSNQYRFEELNAHLAKMSVMPGIAKDVIANEYGVMYEMKGDFQKAIESYQNAAIVTLDSKKLENYRENIERCRKKIELLTPSGRFIN